MSSVEASPTSARPYATLRVRYPKRRGTIALRGDTAPLDWDRSMDPQAMEDEGDTSVFTIPIEPGSTVEVKPVRSDGTWAQGRNLVLAGGDDCSVAPTFDVSQGKLMDWRTLDLDGSPFEIRVHLPPSYKEHDHTRYPVVYAQDGQALWSDGTDPFGLWNLDKVLDDLYGFGSMQEVIVVSVRTAENRVHMLSPVKDPKHEGGGGPAHLGVLADRLKPWIDARFRTRTGREDTALLGSSMGGLFSLFGVWTRPDVFGKAMCLSPSFWWADRWIVKMVQGGSCPAPRPWIYLDSGVAVNPFQKDENQRDGYQHTQAVVRALIHHCYDRGDNLYVLSFPGQSHQPAAWSARAAIPLQLMFPRGA